MKDIINLQLVDEIPYERESDDCKDCDDCHEIDDCDDCHENDDCDDCHENDDCDDCHESEESDESDESDDSDDSDESDDDNNLFTKENEDLMNQLKDMVGYIETDQNDSNIGTTYWGHYKLNNDDENLSFNPKLVFPLGLQLLNNCGKSIHVNTEPTCVTDGLMENMIRLTNSPVYSNTKTNNKTRRNRGRNIPRNKPIIIIKN